MMTAYGAKTATKHRNPTPVWTKEVRQDRLNACWLATDDNRGSCNDSGTWPEDSGTDWHRMSLTREVFDELVVGYLPHLYQLAKYRTDTFEEMQELVQDTLVKAFGARDQFEPGTNLRGWLVTILFNTFRDRLRRAHYRPPMISADALEELDQRLGAAQTRNQWHWQNPEAVGAHADLLHRVQDAINQLPSHFRQVTLMAAIEGCTYQEIAERIGCPIGTVMSRLARGRQRLRRALQNDLDLES